MGQESINKDHRNESARSNQHNHSNQSQSINGNGRRAPSFLHQYQPTTNQPQQTDVRRRADPTAGVLEMGLHAVTDNPSRSPCRASTTARLVVVVVPASMPARYRFLEFLRSERCPKRRNPLPKSDASRESFALAALARRIIAFPPLTRQCCAQP